MGSSPSNIYTAVSQAVSEGSFLWNFFLGFFLLFIFCKWPFALTFAKSSRLVFILYIMSHCFYCNTGYFKNGCRHAQMALIGWLRRASKPHLQASFVSKILRIFIVHSLWVDIPFNPTALGIHLCKTLHLFIFKTRLDGEICSSAVKCISSNRSCENNGSDVVMIRCSNDEVMVMRTTTKKNWFNEQA